MRVLKYIVIAFIVSILVVSGANLLTSEEQSLGAITTILGTDRLTDSRTTINDNFTDLDTTKMEMATSSIDSITTLSNLTAVGALSSGSLTTGFTAIPVSLGGTGTTTPERYRVLFGDGDNGFTMASTSGTNGQFLTSGGVDAYPSWTTSSINEAGEYNWTGIQDWTATGTFAGAASFLGDLFFSNGGATSTLKFSGAGNNASTTVLSTDADGNVSWLPLSRILIATTTDTTASVDTATSTLFSYSVPADTLKDMSSLEGVAHMDWTNLGGANEGYTINLLYGGQLVATSSQGHTGAFSGTYEGTFTFSIIQEVDDAQEGTFSFAATKQTGGLTLTNTAQFSVGAADLPITTDNNTAQTLEITARASSFEINIRSLVLKVIK